MKWKVVVRGPGGVGWILTGESLRTTHRVQAAPATEPRNFSSDPAFGDFNLPLTDDGLSYHLATENESGIECLREALEQDEFTSYDDFRRNELGLERRM